MFPTEMLVARLLGPKCQRCLAEASTGIPSEASREILRPKEGLRMTVLSEWEIQSAGIMPKTKRLSPTRRPSPSKLPSLL